MLQEDGQELALLLVVDRGETAKLPRRGRPSPRGALAVRTPRASRRDRGGHQGGTHMPARLSPGSSSRCWRRAAPSSRRTKTVAISAGRREAVTTRDPSVGSSRGNEPERTDARGETFLIEPVHVQRLVVLAALGTSSTPTCHARGRLGRPAASAASTASPWPPATKWLSTVTIGPVGDLREPGAVDVAQPRQRDDAEPSPSAASRSPPPRPADHHRPAATKSPSSPCAAPCRAPGTSSPTSGGSKPRAQRR